MLKWRVLTALVLIPPFLAALYYLDSRVLAVLLGAFIAAGAWEWAALAGIQRPLHRVGYTVGLVAIGGVGVTAVFIRPTAAEFLFGFSVLWWLWALVDLAIRRGSADGLFASTVARYAAGAMILVPAWVAAIYLHYLDPLRPAALLFLFVLVWVADSAAYFVGRAYGKTRLAPQISPGKSVEGLIGGLCAVLILAYFGAVWIWKLDAGASVWWVVLAAISALFSVLGDLVESKFKRLAGVKNSGRLLPGHGGVLDRIDAFTGAAPVYVLGWCLFTRLGA